MATDCNVIGDSSFNRLLFLQIESRHNFVALVKTFQDLLNKMRREKFFVRLRARGDRAGRILWELDARGDIRVLLRDCERSDIACDARGARARFVGYYGA